MISKEYILSMKVGYILKQIENENEEYREIIQDWTDSEEVAELARQIDKNKTSKNNVTYPKSEIAKMTVMEQINNLNKKDCIDKGYDDYERGVIAGQIFGDLTIKNAQRVMIAEILWNDMRFGYYQEICDYIKDNT